MMTDNDIKKALNGADGLEHISVYCADNNGEDVCSIKLGDIIDLINRQQAEIKEKDESIKAQADKIFLYEQVIKDKTAEIERYLHSIKLLEKDVADAKAELSEFKAMTVNQIADMAIKAFAEKVKNRIMGSTYPSFDEEGKPIFVWKASGYKEIDNLVKEMTEEKRNDL